MANTLGDILNDIIQESINTIVEVADSMEEQYKKTIDDLEDKNAELYEQIYQLKNELITMREEKELPQE